MAPNSQRDSLLKVRSKMLTALDKKLKKDPNWQAFRDLDEMVIESFKANGTVVPTTKAPRESSESPRRGGRPKAAGGTLGDLGITAITEAGKPITTDAMVTYVGVRRELNKDAKRARINVQSAMSHEDRIVSVKWRGGSAWWLKGREVPKED